MKILKGAWNGIKAFTLIEWLVVAAILAIIAAIWQPLLDPGKKHEYVGRRVSDVRH